MHPITLEYIAKEKQKMFLEEAKLYHMRKMAKESRSKIRERMLLHIAEFMISLGSWLIKKYSPVVKTDVEMDSKCNGKSCA